MTGFRHRVLATLGLVGALVLGGCAYDDGYGYGGMSVGTGYYGGGYDPYWDSGYYQPGYFSGWYDNYYYPGSGYYVFDRSGRRHRWSDGQRRYWEGRRAERRDDRWRGRDGRGRDGRWRWREGDRNWQDRDRQPGNGNWGRPPRGAGDGDRNWNRGQNGAGGRDGWRRDRDARPTPQPGLRQPQATPRRDRPQAGQPRVQRNWGNPGRATRPAGGRERPARVRAD